MNAQTYYSLESKPACVLADGPEETPEGDPEYCVCFGDEDGEPICENKHAIWYMTDWRQAAQFGHLLARKFGLEFINEASRP